MNTRPESCYRLTYVGIWFGLVMLGVQRMGLLRAEVLGVRAGLPLVAVHRQELVRGLQNIRAPQLPETMCHPR